MRGITRHALVSLWWFFITQWFFGPAIIDRGFTLTGGQCELVDAAEEGHVDMEPGRKFVTGMACKAVGGKWRGGHDISGHVFLLVLGSMFLFQEVLSVTLKSSKSVEERNIVMPDGAVKSAAVETERHGDALAETQGQWTLGAKFALGVASLSVYMLLMTAAYFHTWFEKVRQHQIFWVNGANCDTVDWTVRCPQRYRCCVLPPTRHPRSEKGCWIARNLGEDALN